MQKINLVLEIQFSKNICEPFHREFHRYDKKDVL
jgi:hypothetical protein